MSKRIVIVGGVAAGASAAAKARRMSEDVEIVLLEAGPYISFANCGLPYYVGGEIAKRDELFVVSGDLFAKRFRVDVRTRTVASAVDRARKTITLRREDGAAEELSYDRLVLATGAVGITPPIAGLGRKNIFTVRTVPDVDAISAFLDAAGGAKEGESVDAEAAAEAPLRAVVIGGGYIGLETAEQLRRRGLAVTVIEMAPQLMPGALDEEMAQPLRAAIEVEGCEVIVGDGVSAIEEDGGGTAAVTAGGRRVPFDIGILSVGVRPNVELAKACGIEIGQSGAIAVDRMQRTSDPAVYAAGDNCEAHHRVLDRPVNIPLAGPANKAGRVAGANAVLDLLNAAEDDGRRLRMASVQGTGIVRVGDQTAGMTGLTERAADKEGMAYGVMFMPGTSHAGYYPGAGRLLLKILYAPDTGRLLGAQAIGADGVDKRIDVLATAIQAGMTVGDLEELDLCYAPPFGSAKDPVIQAGFAASNERRGEMPSMTAAELLERLAGDNPPAVIDVRSKREYLSGHLDEAVNIPVDEIRDRLKDVPTDRPVALHCGVGYRSYVAQRVLMNAGRRDVFNVQGGYGLIQQVQAARQAMHE